MFDVERAGLFNSTKESPTIEAMAKSKTRRCSRILLPCLRRFERGIEHIQTSGVITGRLHQWMKCEHIDSPER